MYRTDSNASAGGMIMRVLLVQHAADLSGSTLSGQLVARGFRRAGWDVDVVFAREGAGVGRYQEIGCTSYILPHKSWLRGGNAIQSVRRILTEVIGSRDFARLIRKLRPDVVYINSIVSLAAAIAARRLKVPCVWHIRELFDDVGGEMRVPRLGRKSLVRSVLQHFADHVVVISRAVFENILGPSRTERVSVVPNAVDDVFFELSATREECRRIFELPVNKLVVGVPGTLRPMKGHEFFFKAAAAIAMKGAEFVIAVTGDGEAAFVDHLRQTSRELGLEDRVRFLGTVTKMAEFYRACDVICVPSKAEPFGRTVIESFAVGTPVVASAVGGIRETVRDGKTGLLVEYGDVPKMASCLTRLLDNARLREKMGRAGRDDASELYSANIYHERINAIVRRVAHANPVGCNQSGFVKDVDARA